MILRTNGKKFLKITYVSYYSSLTYKLPLVYYYNPSWNHNARERATHTGRLVYYYNPPWNHNKWVRRQNLDALFTTIIRHGITTYPYFVRLVPFLFTTIVRHGITTEEWKITPSLHLFTTIIHHRITTSYQR